MQTTTRPVYKVAQTFWFCSPFEHLVWSFRTIWSFWQRAALLLSGDCCPWRGRLTRSPEQSSSSHQPNGTPKRPWRSSSDTSTTTCPTLPRRRNSSDRFFLDAFLLFQMVKISTCVLVTPLPLQLNSSRANEFVVCCFYVFLLHPSLPSLFCVQLVKQTTLATPTSEDHQAPPAQSKKHPRSRSFGGLIKVVRHKNNCTMLRHYRTEGNIKAAGQEILKEKHF